MASIIYKRKRFYKRVNEKGQSLDENEGDGDADRYVSFSLTNLPYLFQKESNRPSNLGKRIKSPTYFVCISKNCKSKMY